MGFAETFKTTTIYSSMNLNSPVKHNLNELEDIVYFRRDREKCVLSVMLESQN